jgi:hypothetical protein
MEDAIGTAELEQCTLYCGWDSARIFLLLERQVRIPVATVSCSVWIFLSLVLAVALGGLFGRGLLAKAHGTAADRSIQLHHHRLLRLRTLAEIADLDFFVYETAVQALRITGCHL